MVGWQFDDTVVIQSQSLLPPFSLQSVDYHLSVLGYRLRGSKSMDFQILPWWGFGGSNERRPSRLNQGIRQKQKETRTFTGIKRV